MMRIAVVGACASGKSTIAAQLKSLGYDAYVVGQEHSVVARLWRRQSPDKLVLLDVSLSVVRLRRGSTWPEWLYLRQQERLSDAREHADVVVDTSSWDVSQCVSEIIDTIDPERLPSLRCPESGPPGNR